MISVYPAPGFNADLAIKAIEKRKTSHLIGTPTMFNDIVNSPIRKNHDISPLSYAIVGGSPATPSLVRLVLNSYPEHLNCRLIETINIHVITQIDR